MRRRRADAGQATVELALVLPVLAGVALVLVSLAGGAAQRLAVGDAARAAARVAATGADDRSVAGVAGRAAPGLATERLAVSVRRDGALVTVTVRYPATVGLPGFAPRLRPVELEASATVWDETDKPSETGGVP
jgi:hypothetical protein